MIDDPGEAELEWSVYDMFGRKMTTATVELTALDQMRIGADYPAGIYNVIVKQGNQTRVVRMIKR
ncbi:T9SS type A sorting domain-containing protein [Flavobacterium sp.]|uniref:T9SS type A sorting domain-containing protein n=1 Tax=Flavobacterium sp. TaxID=239 RepID=UPI0039E30B13